MAKKGGKIKGVYSNSKKKNASKNDSDDDGDSSKSSDKNAAENNNDSDGNSSDADADNSDNVSSDKEEDNAKGNDGLADMMQKILNQNIPSTKQPVLAKRKTQLMKEIENQKGEKSRLQKLRKERKLRREKQLVIPHVLSMAYEKQLKKLATRGVVALFNAIAKAKKDSLAPTEDDIKVSKASNNASKIPSKAKPSLKQITQDNFLQLLNKNDDNKIDNVITKEKSDKSWSVLTDNFFVGNNMTLKDWDKEVSDDDDDNDDNDNKNDNNKAHSKRKNVDPFTISDEKSSIAKKKSKKV